MTNHTISIEKVDNGYIIGRPGTFSNRTQVFRTLEDVMQEMLMIFEGRCESFGGDSYGSVAVFRTHKRGAHAAEEGSGKR